MRNKIILKNPWYILSTSFFKNNDFSIFSLENYLKSIFKVDFIENNQMKINDEFVLKYQVLNEIDYTTIELHFVVLDENKDYFNDEFIQIYNSFWIDLKTFFNDLNIFSEKKYIICNNFLELSFPDELLYNIFYKKIDEVRYIYSSIENNEFVVNFLKHIMKFDIYYSKIINFYKKFSLTYPDLQKSNISLINDYSKIVEWNYKKLDEKDLLSVTKKINILEWVNFGLMYDMESLESNLENLESRLKTIWWQNSRYFLNHIEKAKFIIETFDSVLKKNNLIKENILQNYIKIVQNDIEKQKLENESKKINHLKNIKEILSWLAFIEIFINWLAESAKIFHFPHQIWIVLENTSFMRMVLILAFIVWYFWVILLKKLFLK